MKIDLMPSKSPQECSDYIGSVLEAFDGGSPGWVAHALMALSFGQACADKLANP